ncbi:sigma-E factor negative regulatory protein [Marinospirillum sp.]|uniref:sigma-E factor negative regulatory protein n=1 Tax=Marinospirillum sp. TaxID=2183934 RepID=UPI00286FD7B3|nr:sigma-E factor negative regulatory protein [Marinospirillum sp.]MDR9467634.1 sigma-E factor negative regulatory protein [Marinospirillum sp.]
MTEKLHQSLSSIMDAAGDDLELPRLLTAMQGSPELEQQLGDKWRRYHLVHGILQGDLRGVGHPEAAQVDISAKVMQQLEMEAEPSASTRPSVSHRSDKAQWFRGGALAASVALLVITGVQVFNASKEAVQPGSVPVANQQEQPEQETTQPANRARSESLNGPILQASSSPRSPFSPHAFTGRSLVNYATGEQLMQSRSEANADNFSPVENRVSLQPAASQ